MRTAKAAANVEKPGPGHADVGRIDSAAERSDSAEALLTDLIKLVRTDVDHLILDVAAKKRLLYPDEARVVAGYLRTLSDHVKSTRPKGGGEDMEEAELIEEALKMPRLREAMLAAQQRNGTFGGGDE